MLEIFSTNPNIDTKDHKFLVLEHTEIECDVELAALKSSKGLVSIS